MFRATGSYLTGCLLILALSLLFLECKNQTLLIPNNDLGTRVSHNFPNSIHVEPSLAIHPEDDNKMAVGCIVYDHPLDSVDRKGKLRFYLSDDAGRTWNYSYTSSGSYHAGDPWVNIDTKGTIAIVGLGDQTKQSIMLYYSHDWGEHWKIKEIPNFGKRQYDHPTARFNHLGELVICASQGNGKGKEGYWGLRKIVLDVNFEVKDTEWYVNPPIDFTPGSFDFTTSQHVILPMVSIAEYSQGYQSILDTSTSYTLLFNDRDVPVSSLLAHHNGMGSFPVLAVNKDQSSHGFGSMYFTRHIYNGSSRRILLFKLERGEKDWEYISLEQYMPDTVECKESSVVVNNQGVVGIMWSELAIDGCSRPVFIFSKDGGKSFSSKIYIHETTSCNSTELHNSVKRTNGRSIADRFPTGGDYIGFTSNSKGEFCFVYPYTHSGVYQLFYRSIQISDY